MTMKNNKMTSKTAKMVLFTGLIMTFMVPAFLIDDAEAAKTRACTTNQSPKGVDAVATSEVWVANDGGTLQKFTALSTGCTVTPYTVGPDPHFIDRSASNKITFSEHVSDKITMIQVLILNKNVPEHLSTIQTTLTVILPARNTLQAMLQENW